MALVMDSPHTLQSSTGLQRMRTNSNFSIQPVNNRGAIRKRSSSRAQQLSSSHAERLHQLALDQAENNSLPSTSIRSQWITPQQSPQPHIFAQPSLEAFPQWTVPTPPRSDSGVPTVSVGTSEEPVTTGISSTDDFNFEQATASADMSSLGFLLPSQYGSSLIESEPSSYTMDQNYIPPMRMSQPSATSASTAYAQTISSSPSLYQSRSMPASNPAPRRHSELPNSATSDPAYGQSYRRISNPYDTLPSGDYSMAPTQTIPSISGLTQSPLPSPHIGSTSGSAMMPQYQPAASRSPNVYDTSNMYGQPFTAGTSVAQSYAPTQSMSYPPPFVGSSVNEVLAKPLGSDSSIRVLNQRPKPQCWEHGCNGRQFSTFSNLLRHQREKSGTASKSFCPKCGAEFTRTTARNGHLAHDKCTKQRRQSEGS